MTDDWRRGFPQAVESLRLGASPREAAEDALARVAPFFPLFQGAVVVLAADGAHMPWLRVLLSGFTPALRHRRRGLS